MQFCELTKKEYQQFQMQHSQCNFLNGVETMDLEEMLGYEIQYVGVKEKEAIICASSLVKMPTLKKFYFYYAPRGILIDYHNETLLRFFIKEFTVYAKKRGIVYFICDPYILYRELDGEGQLIPGGFDHSYVIDALKEVGFDHKGFTIGYNKNMQGMRYTYTLTLQDDAKTLFQSFHQQAKRSITKAQKGFIKVRELSYDELPVLVDILSHTGERKQFEARSLAFYQNQCKAYREHIKVWVGYLDVNGFMKDIQQQKQVQLIQKEELQQKLIEQPEHKKYSKKMIVVEETLRSLCKKEEETQKIAAEHGDNIIMSAGMFLLYGEELTYLYGGNYRAFKAYNASYAVQWYAIQKAMELGFKKYNFYGISGEFSALKEDGVYQFKRNFNGQVEELIGDFILPIRNTLYRLYKMLKRS